jgi:serine/threonine protein kinase
MFKTLKAKLSSKSLSKINLKKVDFTFGPLIGEGGLGLVFEATEIKTGIKYAVKAMKKRQIVDLKQVSHVKSEKDLLEQLDHPFIISYKGFF